MSISGSDSLTISETGTATRTAFRYTGILSVLQDDIVSRLNADSFFADVTVLAGRTVNVIDDIQTALGTEAVKGGKSGVCVVVENITGECTSPNVPNGLIDMSIIVSVMEDTQNNDTTKTADEIAFRVKEVLHHYEPEGLSSPLFLDKTCIESVVNPFADESYEVRFRAKALPHSMDAKVATPTVSPTSGSYPLSVTLGCATASASIYWTTDGTYPSSLNSNASLYSSPITISGAAVLRVCAFKTGFIASNCKRVDYT